MILSTGEGITPSSTHSTLDLMHEWCRQHLPANGNHFPGCYPETPVFDASSEYFEILLSKKYADNRNMSFSIFPQCPFSEPRSGSFSLGGCYSNGAEFSVKHRIFRPVFFLSEIFHVANPTRSCWLHYPVMLSAMMQTSWILRQNNFELTIPAKPVMVCLHNLSTSPVPFPKERGFAIPFAATYTRSSSDAATCLPLQGGSLPAILLSINSGRNTFVRRKPGISPGSWQPFTESIITTARLILIILHMLEYSKV